MSDLDWKIDDLDRRLKAVEERLGQGNETTYWPPNPRESDGELLARLGTDAVKWAEEFLRRFRDNTMGPIDEGLMTAWFAAAIGAGEMKNAVAVAYLEWLWGPDWRGVAQRWFERHFADETEPRWEVVPLNAALDPDTPIRLTIVGPAGDGWDGARAATEFHWDDAHSVTVEVWEAAQ